MLSTRFSRGNEFSLTRGVRSHGSFSESSSSMPRFHADPDASFEPSADPEGFSESPSSRSNKRRRFSQFSQDGNSSQLSAAEFKKKMIEAIESLSNPSGRSLSHDELRIIVRLVLWLELNEEYSEFSAVNLASSMVASSLSTIKSAVEAFLATGEICEADASRQGSRNPSHPLHRECLSSDQMFELHRVIVNRKSRMNSSRQQK